MSKYSCFIFDLDNTLYEENIYLFEGYKEISIEIAKKNETLNEEEVYTYLITTFLNAGRTNLFNKMMARFSVLNYSLAKCLTTLRTFKPQNKIYLYSKMYGILRQVIDKSEQVLVVTNGNPIQQKNKVKNINWHDLDKKINFIYANEFEKKPSTKSFEFIKKKYSIDEVSTVMIGDSNFDREYAIKSKIDFIHVEKLIM